MISEDVQLSSFSITICVLPQREASCTFQLQQWHNVFRKCLFCFTSQNLCWDYFAFLWTQLI